MPIDLTAPGVARKFGADRNVRIADFNRRIAALAAEHRMRFVQLLPSNEMLPAEWHIGDGVHLNATGYAVWAARLREALQA
jgi:lysophospholipase L1-like esterase